MKKVRFTFLWTVTFLAVLIVSFAGNHHHHGARVCLTYSHEWTADALHQHEACAGAAERSGRWEDDETVRSGACHRHCTTRICSADRYAAVIVSRPKLPGKSFSWDIGAFFYALLPAGSYVVVPAIVVVASDIPELACRLHTCGSRAWSLRAPPVC